MNPDEDTLILLHVVKHRHARKKKDEEDSPAVTKGKGVQCSCAFMLSFLLDANFFGRIEFLSHAQELVRQWGSEYKATSRIIDAKAKDPREAICDLARDEKIDYIVMGHRGLSPLKKLFSMGSTSSYVSAHSPCPVIVIRAKEGEGKPFLIPRKLSCAI